MTQENKQLLLKDICARLPYGVKVHIHELNVDDYDRKIVSSDISLFELNRIGINPYLRSISSMTEEEQREYNSTKVLSIVDYPTLQSYDWLNEHHFDYRGLIEKRLGY